MLRSLLAVLGGVAWGLTFGREPLAVAAWLALAPLVLLLGSRGAFWLGWLHGLAAWGVSLSWIAPTLVTFGEMPWALAVPLLGLLCAFLALYHAAFAWLGAGVWRDHRRGGWLPLVALPALWVALEWLRTYFLGGFPWNLAAYAWIDVAGALPLSAWIGAYGVSFVVVFANAAAAMAVARRRWQPLAVGVLLPLLVLALAGRWSVARTVAETAESEAAGLAVPVRILQPNIPNVVGSDAQAILANYEKVFALSREACQPGSLLIWPESAAWPFAYGRDAGFARDLETLTAHGCGVLFNSVHPVRELFHNSAFLLSHGRPAERYDKRHLVPFGEYVPFRGVFSFVDKLARNAGEFLPAEEVRLLSWGRERIGMGICYEVVFPTEMAELARRGATLFVTITNDAWYGDTAAPWQHFRAARFRAAENRRPLLRAAITGISALVGSDGSVRAEIGLFEQGVIRARVAGLTGLTPYARAPWLPPLACSLVAAFAIIIVRRRKP